MNKNEFYKELMSRYALDEEKIRVNALKQAKKPAWQRFAADYWKPAVGTAAAVAVTVAAVAYTANSSVPPTVPEKTQTALSASQRLSEAEQNYYNLQVDNPFSDIYITFSEPVSYNDIIMAFSTVSDSGEIRIETLYLENEVLSGSENARGYGTSHSGEKTVIAAKVSALSHYYRDIQDLPLVYLAELGSDIINDDTFSPLPVEDSDPLANDANLPAPVTSTSFSFTSPSETDLPPVTSTSFSFTTPPEDVPSVPVIGESGSHASTLLPPGTESGDIDDDSDPDDEDPDVAATTENYPDADPDDLDPDEIELEETEPWESDPEETTFASSTKAEIPPNEITTSQSVSSPSLLTEIYELNVESSLETHLIGDNAVVLTKNAVYLYTLGGIGMPQSCAVEINSPKISFSGVDTVIITGCRSEDARNIISVIDLDADEIHTYDVSGNIGTGSLGAVRFCPANGKYYIKSVLGEKSFVYEAIVSGGIEFRPLVESDGPVSIAGCKGDTLYLAGSDYTGGNTKLYSFNCTSGDITEIASFGAIMKIKLGLDLESFALISDESTFIYDVNLGMLISSISLDESSELVTYGGKTCYTSGGGTYQIETSSLIEPLQQSITFPKKAESDFEISEITSEKITVFRKNSTTSWIG